MRGFNALASSALKGPFFTCSVKNSVKKTFRKGKSLYTDPHKDLIISKVIFKVKEMLQNCHLPGDVLVIILLKLPIKSLLRFKTVCKSWYAFLDSREFIQMHLRLLTAEKLLCASYASNETFLSIGAENDKYDVSMLHFNSDYKVSLEDSCHGLVCLSLDGLSQIILWNPTTRKHKVIGLPDYSSLSDSLPHIGLGFAPEIDDYKILWIPSPFMSTSDDDEINVWVYSLRSDSWKMVEVLPYACLLWPPTCINACMHWVTSNQTVKDCIVAIDLCSDRLKCLGLPFSVHSSIHNLVALAVINGSLSTVVSHEVESMSRHYEVWIMTKYGVQDSWTKNFVVGPFSIFTLPVGSWKDRKLLFLDMVEKDILLSYDVFTNVVDFESSGFYCFPFLNYIESFESVSGRRRLAPETAVS